MTIRDLLNSILESIVSIIAPLVLYPRVVFIKIRNGDFLEIRIVELFATLVGLAIVVILISCIDSWFEDLKERRKNKKNRS